MKTNELKTALKKGDFNEKIRYIYACEEEKASFYAGRLPNKCMLEYRYSCLFTPSKILLE